MRKRLVVVLAVLVGGLTAVPGTAFGHGPLQSGALTQSADAYVTDYEAAAYTAYAMNRVGWHGGFLRQNFRRDYGWGGFRHVWLNVRARDGSLLISYTRVDGYGRTFVTVWHQ